MAVELRLQGEDGYTAILYNGLSKPEIHIAVVRASNRCDDCSLQADCHALFGPKGEDCKVYPRGRSWVKVPQIVLDLATEGK